MTKKLIAKSLLPVPINLKISATACPTDCKKSNYDMYAVFADVNAATAINDDDASQEEIASEQSNIFETCALISERGTEPALRVDTSAWHVCQSPSTANDTRNFSMRQRSQNLLGGMSVASEILTPLLSECAQWPPLTALVTVNLSPFEGAYELVTLSLRDKVKTRTFSATSDVDLYTLCDLRMKKQFMNDWKRQDFA